MLRSLKFRIRPNKAQALALDAMLGDLCALYNASLEQRIDAYRRRGVSLRYGNQAAELKAVRSEVEGLDRWSFTSEQQVLRRVEKTFAAFFKRGRGFPRFRARSMFDSADMRVGDGLSIRKTGRLTVVGVPGQIKAVWHREMTGKLGHAVLSRSGGKWHVCFQVEIPDAEPIERLFVPVGIDLGLTSLIATSEGETVKAPRFARMAAASLRRRQRALARCKRGSIRRGKAKARVAAASARVARQRRDFAHKLSASLVARYSHIAFENLNMNGLKRGMLARSIHDAAWSQIISLTTYKAESAGSVTKLVDTRCSSQECPVCGSIRLKQLSERMHRCDCGYVRDRDVAAAQIVLRRAEFTHGTCVRAPSQPAAA